MKHISESIIGRKGLEILYIVWPNWSTGVICLRKEEKFEELETQMHNTIFIISESDLINNRYLFNDMDAVFYRSEKPDTISNVINKLKEFIETGDVDDILDIGFKQCEIDEIWKKLKIKI